MGEVRVGRSVATVSHNYTKFESHVYTRTGTSLSPGLVHD